MLMLSLNVANILIILVYSIVCTDKVSIFASSINYKGNRSRIKNKKSSLK